MSLGLVASSRMKKAADRVMLGLHRSKPSFRCRHLSALRGSPDQRKSSPVAASARQALRVMFLADPSQWWETRSDKMFPDYRASGPRKGELYQPRFVGYGRSWRDGPMYTAEVKICEAVEELDLLVQRGSCVSRTVFYRVLRNCSMQKNLALGKHVHCLILEAGYESDRFLANHIICMYASHGMLGEATDAFTKVAAPDAYMWASIILAHARQGQPMHAVKLYRQMRKSTVKPDNRVFVAALQACASAADLACGKEVHADILGSAVEPDLFVSNCLVDMYAKCGSVVNARRVFDKLPTKDVVTWNAMIAGYGSHGLVQEAMSLYTSMQNAGRVLANTLTFVCLLKACSSVGALHQGKQLHAQICERGLEADVVVGNCLVDMYAKCGSVVDARQAFDKLHTKDVVTWNSMIAGYVQHGPGEEALSLYTSMQEEGTVADIVTFVSLLKACASLQAVHRGKQFHMQIQERGLESNMVVGRCLVNMYAKCGSLVDAYGVFAKLPEKHVATWNAVIGGYADHGFSQEALSLYADMQHDGKVLADSVTFVYVLKACTSLGALSQGKQVHAQIQERGLEADVVVGSCLVDMYAKCGNLKDARRVLDNMPISNVVTWTSLLNGYAQNNDSRRAMQCFDEMQQKGIEPDEATFTCILVACSHGGSVNEGQRYFRMMVEDHGIMPTAYHYSCMIDLLGRSGCLDEAEKMLQSGPVIDDIVAWISLLSACKSHGDLVRGRRCFDHLVTLDPENSTAYILLAAMYASAGKWGESQKIERLRKSAGAKKKPARACIEVNSRVHEFLVGQERAGIFLKSLSLNLRLKNEGGHVPHTELVLKPVSESKKEDALCGHAEKLALAFGLLKTAAGTPLLVTKNLRMCIDCHSATKIMSTLEKREITVRDAHRVHHFVDGSCSCGDRH